MTHSVRIALRRPTCGRRGPILAALAATAALAALAALGGCKGAGPALTLERLAVQRLSLGSAELLATWRIDNSNGWAIHVDEACWTLFSGADKLAEGVVSHATEVPASGSAPLHMHIELPYSRLPRAAASVADEQQHGQIPYRITGRASFTSPFGPVSAPFVAEGQLPVVRELEFGRPSLSVLEVTQTRVGLRMEMDVRNPNALWLAPDRLTGSLLINRRPLVELDEELSAAGPIGPEASGRLGITAWVTSPEIGVKSLAELIRTPGADCRLRGDLRFRVLEAGQVQELAAEHDTALPR